MQTHTLSSSPPQDISSTISSVKNRKSFFESFSSSSNNNNHSSPSSFTQKDSIQGGNIKVKKLLFEQAHSSSSNNTHSYKEEMIEKLDRKRESSGDSMIKKIQSQLTETTTCSSNIHRVHIDVTGNKETFEKFKNLETNHSCETQRNSSTHSTIVDVSHRNSVRLESEKYDQQVQELLSSNIPYTYKPVDSKTLWRSFPVHSTSSMDSCDIHQMNDLSHVSGPTSTAPIIPVHSIPEKTNIYIHPLSDDVVIDIFDENDQPVGHSTAFITAYGKPPGKYTAHAYFQKSNNNNERLPLQQFDFVIGENGHVSPDFVNLNVKSTKFEFRKMDQPVANTVAECLFSHPWNQSGDSTFRFKTCTDEEGSFSAVLPAGSVQVHLPEMNILTTSHIVEPLPIQNREQAIRNVRQTFTHSEDATVAGSSLTSEGDVVVLGDISESMAGDPLQTLVKCMKLFLQKALERKQRIALAVWSTNCYWYQNGAFVDENTENLQQEVESWILEQFHDHGSPTYMKACLKNTKVSRTCLLCVTEMLESYQRTGLGQTSSVIIPTRDSISLPLEKEQTKCIWKRWLKSVVVTLSLVIFKGHSNGAVC